MDRRTFLKHAGAGSAAMALGVSSCGKNREPEVTDSGKRPNIIFLLTDDQRWDTLGCMGNSIIRTPNLDGLAQNGVLFRNCFVTTPICCASRASIFTGQYARRHGINDFSTDFTPAQFADIYPSVLRRDGYFSGFVGKYGINNREEDMPKNDFDVWYGIAGQPVYETKDDKGNDIHSTRLYGNQCMDFLRQCPDDRPFHLSVSFKAPHVQDGDPRQFIPDPAYDDLYSDVTIPVPMTADPRYFDMLPGFLKDSEARRRWELRFATPEMYQQSVKNYYRLITGVDVVVGDIMNELDLLGMADNTIIVFSGDNGFYLGEHGLAGKWFGHEESLRVPLFVYDPRLPRDLRGQVRDEMVLNVDIAPTLLSACSSSIPSSYQGNDLMPLVRNESTVWREDFLFEHLFRHEKIQRSEGVVGTRWKYLRYIDQEPVYEELYDRVGDPLDERNIAGEQANTDLLGQMRNRCDELTEMYS